MNQYMPKAHQELSDTRKAHVYSIRGTLDQGIFTVYVYDQMTKNEFEQKFNQQNFPNMKLFDIAKAVVDAINSTMNGSGSPSITCREWNGMAFVTVLGGEIPTLALPPKGADQSQVMALQQQAQQASQQHYLEQQQAQYQQSQNNLNANLQQQQQPEIGTLNAANLESLGDMNQGQMQNFQQQMYDQNNDPNQQQMQGYDNGYGQQQQYGSQMQMNENQQMQQQQYDNQYGSQQNLQQQYGSQMNMNQGMGGYNDPNMYDNGQQQQQQMYNDPNQYGSQMNMQQSYMQNGQSMYNDPNMQQMGDQNGGYDMNQQQSYDQNQQLNDMQGNNNDMLGAVPFNYAQMGFGNQK